MQAMNIVIALTIIAGSVVDIGPTTASYTSSLRDVRMVYYRCNDRTFVILIWQRNY